MQMQLSPPTTQPLNTFQQLNCLKALGTVLLTVLLTLAFYDLMVGAGVKSCLPLTENSVDSCVITSELFKPLLRTNCQLMERTQGD